MIKKLLLSAMLMLTCVGIAKAEGEGQSQQLTVFDACNTSNEYVPVWGYSTDSYQKCEMIYPAENLNTMAFTSISRMDFYTSTPASKAWTATFQVYLKEVGQSAFPSEDPTFIDFSEDDLVYEGLLDATGEVMSIVFDSVYYYQGGNLLVGIYVTQKGNYKRVFFLGEEVSNACIYGKNSTSLDLVTPNKSNDKKFFNFLPKTTFHFTKIEQPVLSAPVSITASDVTQNSATIGWSSNAAAWQICINDDEEHPVDADTNPFTLTGLESGHYYEVKVRAVNGDEVSDWSNETASFTTLYCSKEQMVNISCELKDDRSDGWAGNAILVKDTLTGDTLATWTIAKNESAYSDTLSVCIGRVISFEWISGGSGSYPYDCSYVVRDPYGEIIFEGSNAMADTIYYTVSVANPRPTELTVSNISINSAEIGWNQKGDATQWQLCVNNDMEDLILADSNPFTLTDLEYDTQYTVMLRAYKDEDNISKWSDPLSFTTAEICPKPTSLSCVPGSTEATMSWDGTLDSYVLQYNVGWKLGEDVTVENSRKTYTFDLRSLGETGSIAIRHYNVTDKFWLHVDSIVVTNAEGTTVYSEDFENCGGVMPAKISTIDYDGDGYGWEVRKESPDWIFWGEYGVSSACYKPGVGALTPNDWLIINDVELGGTLSFMAYSQTYNDDNFAVYVFGDSYMIEVPVNDSTTYHATQLVNNAPYIWRVKGVNGSDQSRWVSSMFETPYDPNVTPTGIRETHQAANDKSQVPSDEWFTIVGRKCSGKPNAKGVYIKNGKKVVIK